MKKLLIAVAALSATTAAWAQSTTTTNTTTTTQEAVEAAPSQWGTSASTWIIQSRDDASAENLANYTWANLDYKPSEGHKLRLRPYWWGSQDGARYTGELQEVAFMYYWPSIGKIAGADFNQFVRYYEPVGRSRTVEVEVNGSTKKRTRERRRLRLYNYAHWNLGDTKWKAGMTVIPEFYAYRYSERSDLAGQRVYRQFNEFELDYAINDNLSFASNWGYTNIRHSTGRYANSETNGDNYYIDLGFEGSIGKHFSWELWADHTRNIKGNTKDMVLFNTKEDDVSYNLLLTATL